MTRIELRDPTDADRDAVFALLRDGAATWPRDRFTDRSSFDAWLAEQIADADVQTVADDTGARGLVAVRTVNGDREIVFAMPSGPDEAVTTEALRQMASREPVRPLYARVSAGDDPSHDVLAGVGFVESSRDGDEIVYVLPPTLE